MALVTQRIDNLLGGVSTLPGPLRLPSQAGEQINALANSRGLTKRPPSLHVAKIAADPTGYEGAFIHTVYRDNEERYRVVLVNGTARVFDVETGQEYPVDILGSGAQYLTGSTTGFRAMTVGDTTVVVNRDKAVTFKRKASPISRREALVFVRQADFSTTYYITLAGVNVNFTTVDASNPQARMKIGTEQIATELLSLLEAREELEDFKFARYGSTIYIYRADGKDFRLSVSDGLADKGLKAVKESVQHIEDLPERAPNGFAVEITGDPGHDKDNAWVVYDDNGNPAQDGVWRETVKPGSLTDLDASTMPHQLVRGGRYMEERTCEGVPLAPDAADGKTRVTRREWVEWIDGGIVKPKPQGTDHFLRKHQEALRLPVSKDLLGRSEFLQTHFSIDTSVMETGAAVDAAFYRITAGGTRIPVGTQRFLGGQIYQDQTFTTTADFFTGDRLELRLEYGEGVDPAKTSRQALLTAPSVTRAVLTEETISPLDVTPWAPPHDPDAPPWLTEIPAKLPPPAPGNPVRPPVEGKAPIEQMIVVSRIIRFDMGGKYPQGYGLTVRIGPNAYSYTVAGQDMEAADFVDAVRAAIPNGSGWVVNTPAPGVIEIESTDENWAVPVVRVESTWNYANCWLPKGDLVPGTFAGKTLMNLSDGSQGLITGNTSTMIQCESLTGGAKNYHRKGDKVIVVGTGIYFTFGPIEWRGREVGSLETNPWPSFVGKRISEVFFSQGRLGFTSGESVVLSATDDLFNFFRYSVTSVLADDPIDVTSAHPEVSVFHSAVPFNGGVYLFSDRAQFKLWGDPVLTPTTVRLDAVSSYPSSPRLRPVPAGGRLFMARGHSGVTQVLDYQHREDWPANADDVTLHVQGYLKGQPVALATDSALGFLAVATTEDRSALYIYLYAFREDGARLQASWGKWVFSPGTDILYIDAFDGKLGIIARRPDGIFYETVDLSSTLSAINL